MRCLYCNRSYKRKHETAEEKKRRLEAEADCAYSGPLRYVDRLPFIKKAKEKNHA